MALSIGGESLWSKSAVSTVAVGAENTFAATSRITFGRLRAGVLVSNPRPRDVTQSIIFLISVQKNQFSMPRTSISHTKHFFVFTNVTQTRESAKARKTYYGYHFVALSSPSFHFLKNSKSIHSFRKEAFAITATA